MHAEALFLFGTLRDLELLETVAGCAMPVEEAELSGHVIAHAVSADGSVQDFPMFSERDGAVARGLLIRPNPQAQQRLDAYERVFGYDTTKISVQTASGLVEALIYLPEAGLWSAGEEWSLEQWRAGPGQFAVEVAAEVMRLLPTTAPRAIFERFQMLEIRAASRRRAAATSVPASLRRQPVAGDVDVLDMRTPYTWFFGVEEADVKFRRFDGSLSPEVTRAGFIMGDAVTVLPYDPMRDAVMLVEQFRFGPHARGDKNPWSLEPIAGRIDPTEAPETAARREAREEARLSMRALHEIGRYYVSPGAVTEYLISYVGIADLPASAEGVSGLEIEAEDIRAHVIPFSQLMSLLESGEIANGPLIISVQWLALNRDWLRAEP